MRVLLGLLFLGCSIAPEQTDAFSCLPHLPEKLDKAAMVSAAANYGVELRFSEELAPSSNPLSLTVPESVCGSDVGLCWYVFWESIGERMGLMTPEDKACFAVQQASKRHVKDALCALSYKVAGEDPSVIREAIERCGN